MELIKKFTFVKEYEHVVNFENIIFNNETHIKKHNYRTDIQRFHHRNLLR